MVESSTDICMFHGFRVHAVIDGPLQQMFAADTDVLPFLWAPF